MLCLTKGFTKAMIRNREGIGSEICCLVRLSGLNRLFGSVCKVCEARRSQHYNNNKTELSRPCFSTRDKKEYSTCMYKDEGRRGVRRGKLR